MVRATDAFFSIPVTIKQGPVKAQFNEDPGWLLWRLLLETAGRAAAERRYDPQLAAAYAVAMEDPLKRCEGRAKVRTQQRHYSTCWAMRRNSGRPTNSIATVQSLMRATLLSETVT